jgi:hypothetical protein
MNHQQHALQVRMTYGTNPAATTAPVRNVLFVDHPSLQHRFNKVKIERIMGQFGTFDTRVVQCTSVHQKLYMRNRFEVVNGTEFDGQLANKIIESIQTVGNANQTGQLVLVHSGGDFQNLNLPLRDALFSALVLDWTVEVCSWSRASSSVFESLENVFPETLKQSFLDELVDVDEDQKQDVEDNNKQEQDDEENNKEEEQDEDEDNNKEEEQDEDEDNNKEEEQDEDEDNNKEEAQDEDDEDSIVSNNTLV